MKTQFGRSMIEMLGVLAIVGVLVIGGVWGYRKAVTKYLANSVIDDINLSGFLVMDELFSSLPDDDVGLDLTGRFDQKSPYTFKAFAETGTSFEILVSGVPYPVCQELKEREFKDIDEVRANGLVDECLSSGDNEISFFFDTDPTAGTPCETDEDCSTACGKCNSKNRCRSECEITPDSCTSNDDCAESGVCAGCIIPDGQDTGTCQYACTEVSYLESSKGTERIDTGWYVDWDENVEVSGTFSVPDLDKRRIIIGAHSTQSTKELNIEYIKSDLEESLGDFRVYVDGGGYNGHAGFDDYLYNVFPADTSASFSYKYSSKTGMHTYSTNGKTGSKQFKLSGNADLVAKLFGDNRGPTVWGTMKLYGITIKNGRTYMDLVPVLDPDGEPAMLDKINQKLYYNMGSGTFVTDKD